MTYEFRWNDWNVEHIAAHGVTPTEAEFVVEHPDRGFPRRIGDGRYLVWGRTAQERYLQVIHVYSPPHVVFVIHSRDLTEVERRRLRRRRR